MWYTLIAGGLQSALQILDVVLKQSINDLFQLLKSKDLLLFTVVNRVFSGFELLKNLKNNGQINW